eukprot:4521589-Pyramimonas_sp.AAC.1
MQEPSVHIGPEASKRPNCSRLHNSDPPSAAPTKYWRFQSPHGGHTCELGRTAHKRENIKSFGPAVRPAST